MLDVKLAILTATPGFDQTFNIKNENLTEQSLLHSMSQLGAMGYV
jgi:hypothetical protein